MIFLGRVTVLLALFLGCGETPRNRTSALEFGRGVTGLDQDIYLPFKRFLEGGEELSSEEALVGEKIQYQLNFSTLQLLSFYLADEGRHYLCHFQYRVKEITEEIIEIDDELWVQKKSSIPSGAAVFPEGGFADLEKLCRQALEKVEIPEKSTKIDFKKSAEDFRALLRREIIDLVEKCKLGDQIDGQQCLELKIHSFIRDQPLVYAKDVDVYTFDSSFQLGKEQRHRKIQFNLSWIYFSINGLMEQVSVSEESSFKGNVSHWKYFFPESAATRSLQ